MYGTCQPTRIIMYVGPRTRGAGFVHRLPRSTKNAKPRETTLIKGTNPKIDLNTI